MASIINQRLDSDGLYIQVLDGSAISLPISYCKSVVDANGGDLVAASTALKNYIVSVLGETQISFAEMKLAVLADGTIKTFITGIVT